LTIFRFSEIFWIDASSDSIIDLKLKEIAQENNAKPEEASSASSVLEWISKKSNWLIIYDNADSGCNMIEKFLLLRLFVNFVTQGYKGTVGSSREFRHLMTKEV